MQISESKCLLKPSERMALAAKAVEEQSAFEAKQHPLN